MEKILLMSIGSRGDMEPFLAKGEELKSMGHQIGFCLPKQFENLAKEVEDTFFPMDPSFVELLESPEVKMIMGQVGSGLVRIRALLKLIKSTKKIQQQLIIDQHEAVKSFQPAKIIFHIKCIYPVIWAITTKNHVELLSPMPGLLHALDDEPHVGFGRPRGKWWNRFTYWLADRALISQSILGYGKSFLKENNITLSYKKLKSFLHNELPTEYAVSQRIFKRPNDWPSHVKVINLRDRNKTKNYKPSEALESFLSAHPYPLFISFGSMINSKPKQIGKDILKVSQQLDFPIIINSSWGGIEIEGPAPPNVCIVNDVPYDYLFPKIKAGIHHGGSGTTHSLLRCNKPQAIIPHIGDQFYWNRAIKKHGLGISGFPIKKWDINRFEQLVKELLNFKITDN